MFSKNVKKIYAWLTGHFKSDASSNSQSCSNGDELSGRIHSNNWLQGDIFNSNFHPKIGEQLDLELKDDDLCIVISQSCNIVFHDFQKEPCVELLIAKRIAPSTTGNYFTLRNPRRLDFFATDESNNKNLYSVVPTNKYNIPRQLLASTKPSSIKIDDLNILISWIVARYERIAFPNNFNDRITKKIKSQMKKDFEKLTDVSHIFIALNSWEELNKDQSYEVSLVFVMPVSKYEDSSLRAQMDHIALEFSSRLDGCEGINSSDYELKSEDEFTLHDIRIMKLWNDSNYFSHEDEDKHAMPVI